MKSECEELQEIVNVEVSYWKGRDLGAAAEIDCLYCGKFYDFECGEDPIAFILCLECRNLYLYYKELLDS